MPYSQFSHVNLRAISAIVPKNCIRMADELIYFENNPENATRLSAISGLAERRLAPEGVTVLDLAENAAKNLLLQEDAKSLQENTTQLQTTDINQSAPIPLKESIDAVLFATHSTDYPLPANASLLQHRLEISKNCIAMDINVGCAAFVHGLWLAAGMVESGAAKRVLLVTGDTPGRFTSQDNRTLAPVFGDSASAVLVEYTTESNPISFLSWNDGSKYEALVIPGGGSRIPYKKDEAINAPYKQIIYDSKNTPWALGGYCQLWMDGMMIYAFSVAVVPDHIKEHLIKDTLTPDTLGGLFLHQANKIMLNTIIKKTGFSPEKAPQEALKKYGNLGGNSIPVLLCDYYGQDPDRNQETTKADSKVMLCGFGAGLAVSSCILSLKKTRIYQLQEIDAVANTAARKQEIQKQQAIFAEKV